MVAHLLSVCLLSAVGCQPIAITPTTSDTPVLEPISPTSSVIFPTLALSVAAPQREPVGDTARESLQHAMEGVSLSLRVPVGWEGVIMDGLLMAEHTAAMDDGALNTGMLLYIFAPSLREFAVLTPGDNYAYSVLSHVVRMPQRVGRDVSVSEPVGFLWDGYEAAYYLLSGIDARTMVLAVALPRMDSSTALVVCNLSVPNEREAALRPALPIILDGLTIDGIALPGAALSELPDPLPFPALPSSSALLPTSPPR